LSVGALTSGGGYSYHPVTDQFDTETEPDVPLYDDTLSTARRWVGDAGMYNNSGGGPYTAYISPAFSEPRPWQIGLVSRGSATLTVPGASYQGRFAEVPVWFGLTVVTPAGTFHNCVAMARLMEYAPAGTTNQWKWEHWYTILAPGIGPVGRWDREGSQTGTIEGEPDPRFGLLQSADVGGTHHP
jgi:hypothetical protein